VTTSSAPTTVPPGHPATLAWVDDADRAPIERALAVDTADRVTETRSIGEWFARSDGNRLPEEPRAALKLRLLGNH
jgi:phosphoenolpyruvate carboxykinase (GTP)